MNAENNNNNRSGAGNGGNRPSGSGQRRYHHNRNNNNRPNNNGGPRPQGQGPSQRNNNNNANGQQQARPQNPNQQGQAKKTIPPSRVVAKYDNLLDQHLLIRKKYFEQFDRVSMEERRRLEQRFFHSIAQLREYEDSLESWQKEILSKKTDGLKLDVTYSSNHELPVVPEPVPAVGQFDDPHFSLAQKNRQSYKDDTEESVGTIEDYKKLKGLY